VAKIRSALRFYFLFYVELFIFTKNKGEIMNSIIGSIVIGIAAGIVDVLPMLMKKMDKSACASAFIQYMVVSFIIVHTDIPGISWWIEGALISLLMALPIIIIIPKNDSKAVPVIIMMALALGALISQAAHHLISGIYF
jgi:hypothetical protein